jgi:hypothetical protein
MAPKKLRAETDTPGRDADKVFLIEEMPALQAEAWAYKALLALSNGGVDIPDDMIGGGMAVLASYGLKALGRLKYADAAPLLSEMLECVQICPDPRNPQVKRPLVGNDIEEVATLVRHTNFSMPGSPSISPSTTASLDNSTNIAKSMGRFNGGR